MITSTHNTHLKEIRRLHRRRGRDQAGRFVAEGEDLVAAADAAGWPALERYCAAGSGVRGTEVAPEALRAVSTLGSGTRALAVYEQRWVAPAGPLCVALWGVADPGNVGTVLRSAAAFRAASVALGPGCADPYGPKAVRASMGAVFAVPLARVRAPDELPGERVALVAGKGEPLREVAGDPRGEVSVLTGAERDGLPADVVAACDRVAHIPIATESLNAAMAATIALYELRMARP
ncbi:MAG TPA: RNA methyltransferase [Solirubrobacteraceae bacterium]|nr:RNA methyltransferase [Solirubrobacteraceae bacterium]